MSQVCTDGCVLHVQKPNKAQPARGGITASRASTSNAAVTQSSRLQPQRVLQAQQAQHAEPLRHAKEPAVSQQSGASLQPRRSYLAACPAELSANALVASPMQVPPATARNRDPGLAKSFLLARKAGWSSIVRIKGRTVYCSFTHNTALLNSSCPEA